MKVKIVVNTGVTEEGSFNPGDMPDIREATAEEWIKRGWAIAQAEPKPPEPPPVQKAVIETPEDHSAAEERETATLKRKKK